MEIVVVTLGTLAALFAVGWLALRLLGTCIDGDHWRGAFDEEEEAHAEDVETAAEKLRERDDRIETLVAQVNTLQDSISRLQTELGENAMTIADQGTRLLLAERVCAARGGTLEGLEKIFEEKEAHIEKITTAAAQNGADLAWYRMLASHTRNMPAVHSSLFGITFELINLNDDPGLKKLRDALKEFGTEGRPATWEEFTEELASLPVPMLPTANTRRILKRRKATGARKARS